MPPLPLSVWALPAGALLDAILGDPRGWPHPVRWIGGLIRFTERVLDALLNLSHLPRKGAVGYVAGVILLVIVAGTTGLSVWASVALASRTNGLVLFVVETLLIYWGLAIRSLGVESLRASDEPDLIRARGELAMIVGRDTDSLDRPEICRACVETVAENCNDAIVAPLFWFAVGGVIGLWVYKAVNTLDSMVGYRNERYLCLGWASARFDDVLNLIPARLTWLLISLGSVFVGECAGQALRIGWRDGRNHPSPNAAWGEAAMAGALGVQLGGVATYRGVPGEKPRLGDPGEPIEPQTVHRAVRVMHAASLLTVGIAWLGRFWLASRA